MDSSVTKAISEDEKTVLSNIQSLIQQLMTATEETPMEEETEVVEMQKEEKEKKPKEEEEKKEENEIEKTIETTPSDASTASDDTEKKIEEVQSEESVDNVDEVAKTFATALSALVNKKQVKKSQATNPVIHAMQELTNVVKGLTDNQNAISGALTQLFDGLGISKQLEINKSLQEQNGVKTGQPITSDNKQILEVIKEVTKSLGDQKEEKENVNLSNSQRVHRNLADSNVLQGLTGIKVGPRTLIDNK